MRGGVPAGAEGPVDGGMGGTPPMLSVVASDATEDDDMVTQVQGWQSPSKWIQNAADTRTSALSDVHV